MGEMREKEGRERIVCDWVMRGAGGRRELQGRETGRKVRE